LKADLVRRLERDDVAMPSKNTHSLVHDVAQTQPVSLNLKLCTVVVVAALVIITQRLSSFVVVSATIAIVTLVWAEGKEEFSIRFQI
jgi:hypothetical protein